MAKARFGSAVMTSTGWEADKGRVSAHHYSIAHVVFDHFRC
jgi:hypothetical protein